MARIHEESAKEAHSRIFTDPFPREETQHRWNSYVGAIALASHDCIATEFGLFRRLPLTASRHSAWNIRTPLRHGRQRILAMGLRNFHATLDTNARELRFSRLTGSLT